MRQLLRVQARFADDWHACCDRPLPSARGRIEGVPQTESGGQHVAKHVVEFGGTVRMVGSRCRISLGVRPPRRTSSFRPSSSSFPLGTLARPSLSTARGRGSALQLPRVELPASGLLRRGVWRIRWLQRLGVSWIRRWLWIALWWKRLRWWIGFWVLLLEVGFLARIVSAPWSRSRLNHSASCIPSRTTRTRKETRRRSRRQRHSQATVGFDVSRVPSGPGMLLSNFGSRRNPAHQDLAMIVATVLATERCRK